MQQKFEWLSQLDRMENPMRNLIDVMKNAVSNMAHAEETSGISKYHEVYNLLSEAEDNISKALKKANRIAYALDK